MCCSQAYTRPMERHLKCWNCWLPSGRAWLYRHHCYSNTKIEAVLDNLCGFSRHQKVYFLWRPYLPNPKDDLVLELAVAADVNTIVTHNLKDFVRAEKFGVEAITPKTLLEKLI